MPVNKQYDIVVIGSGFGGSLLAMIACRAGRSVLILEKGTHPRFAIGESSTPLSNLLLEEVADCYDLPRLKPFAKWGTWQQAYPDVAAGLKRGFSFYHHVPGAPARETFARDEQLLVAASPNDAMSDSHWCRADFDHFFLREAEAMGAKYLDRVALSSMTESDDGVTITGDRLGELLTFRARFLVDATGPRGFVHRALGLQESAFPYYPQTQALYSHFSNVALFDPGQPGTPYPVDDAALHHVFDGGWIWVLRFNNGLTSAGVAARDSLADGMQFREGGAAWERVMDLLPAVKQQFAAAEAEIPFVHARRLSFLSDTVAGKHWAMLPSAAAFIDPLLSTGFPLTLLGIARLGEILTQDWGSPIFANRLRDYAERTKREAHATARLVGALYASMDNFPLFASVSLLYFAAASFTETARRLDRHHLASSFLLCDNPVFDPASERLCAQARRAKTPTECAALHEAILEAIEPFNVAGLGDPQRRNWYPVNSDDLLRAAGKFGDIAPAAVFRLLERSGFRPAGETL